MDIKPPTIQSNTPIFTSRNKTIRDLDKICRLIDKEFPAISSTKVSEFESAKKDIKFQKYTHYLYKNIQNLVRDPAWKLYNEKSPELFYIKLVEGIKDFRLANCGDFSKICKLICNINGIKSKKAEMTLIDSNGYLKGNIDHAIQIISLDGEVPFFERLGKLHKTIIMDPWLGFVDYAPNFEIKLKSEYNKFFQVPKDYNIAINCSDIGEPEITPQALKILKNTFPQFQIKELIKPNKS